MTAVSRENLWWPQIGLLIERLYQQGGSYASLRLPSFSAQRDYLMSGPRETGSIPVRSIDGSLLTDNVKIREG